MTNRPAHPDTHDPVLRKRLEDALIGEVVIPCTDLQTLRLLRARVAALLKAHRSWFTPMSRDLAALRTKALDTFKVNQARPELQLDSSTHPYCLVLDARDLAAKALEAAVVIVPATEHPKEIIQPHLMSFDEDFVDPEEDADILSKTLLRYKDNF